MDNKLLFLDSEKSSNNIFTLDKRISGEYRLVSFIYTNNIYNVTDNNNKIYWNENGSNLITTLVNGYYDSSDFTSHCSTQLNSDASGTVTVSLDSNTKKYTITDTLNFYLTFGSNTGNSARKLLGFAETDGINNTTQTSSTAIDLNTCKSVFVTIEQDDHRLVEGIDFFNSSLMISGVADFGEAFRYIDVDNFCQFVKFRQTKKLSLTFHDTSNNSINLNSEYQIIFKKM
jgi:hypothetical protein